MATILDLFKNKDFVSKKLSRPDVLTTTTSPVPTLLERYNSSNSYKFGENYSSIKSDRETLVEQETTGIRVESKVELNNPLIYGSETVRIFRRSTEMLDSMKSDRGIDRGIGGVLTSPLEKAKTTVNNIKYQLLGFPAPFNPSNIIEIGTTKGGYSPITGFDPTAPKIFRRDGSITSRLADFRENLTGVPSGPGNEQDTAINLAAIKNKFGGTEIGKLLQKSLKGNPNAIGQQIVGGGIQLVKDKIRNTLFGTGDLRVIEPQKSTDFEAYGSSTNKYSYVQKQIGATIRNEGDIDAEEFLKQRPNLKKVSPLYGVQRKGSVIPPAPEGEFGNTEYGYRAYSSEKQSKYSPLEGEQYNADSAKGTSLRARGYDTTDTLNSIAPSDFDRPNSGVKYNAEKDVVEVGGNPIKDLIPFHITRVGQNKNFFRALISGLSENVSPSWNSQNFVGNPYKFYTYENIERGINFNLNIYCGNPLELAKNWEKISYLTKAAYPIIPFLENTTNADGERVSSNITRPPIIQFTLGDMYKNRYGIIETLTYTIPDNGTWETEQEGWYLPKFIETQISIKLIDDVVSGNVENLYSFKKDTNGNFTTPENIQYQEFNTVSNKFESVLRTDWLSQTSATRRINIRINDEQ